MGSLDRMAQENPPPSDPCLAWRAFRRERSISLEWTQKRKKKLDFRLLDQTKNESRNLYHVQMFIDDQGYAEASDYSIKGAEQRAAEKTWLMLNN